MEISLHFSPTEPSDRPVFVLASGHRCGSTLLQRLLNSAPDILIWGEHNGYLNGFLREYTNLVEWGWAMHRDRRTFLLKGYDNFVAKMVPEEYELRGAAVAHVATLFGVPAARLGRSTWGFKEVRYGAQLALFLQGCFPRARFIHLTRNIVHCFLSLKRWEVADDPWHRGWTERSLEDWQRINESFLEAGSQVRHLLRIRYEDMIADPDAFVTLLAGFLELPVATFDRSVFDRRLSGTAKAKRPEQKVEDLDDEERQLVFSERARRIAEAYGYAMAV